MLKYQAVKGFKDVFGRQARLVGYIEAKSRSILEAACFEPIKLPIVEYSELFTKSVGISSDIVQKEMYTFADLSGRDLTLRPEGTAGFVRAYLEHGFHKERPISRFYYMGPMFRHEKPQKARLRQFDQLGVEAMGIAEPFLDAELVSLVCALLNDFGVRDYTIQLSSIGCRVCRERLKKSLLSYLIGKKDKLCKDCLRRMDLNPFRTYDCKVCLEILDGAPSILEGLCVPCKNHFDHVQKGLDALGIDYIINPKIVRGLDYYTRTTFEVYPKVSGAQSVLIAGGRYDNLVEMMGGPPTPGIGFAMGVERIVDSILSEADNFHLEEPPKMALVPVNEKELFVLFKLLPKLREQFIACEVILGGQSLKAKLRFASKRTFRYVVMVNYKSNNNEIILRDLKQKTQINGPLNPIWIRQKINEGIS